MSLTLDYLDRKHHETDQREKGPMGEQIGGCELDRMQAPATPRVATPYPAKSVVRRSRRTTCQKRAAQPRQPPLPLPCASSYLYRSLSSILTCIAIQQHTRLSNLDYPPPIIHPPSQFPGHSLQSVAQHLSWVCVRKIDSVAMASMTAAMVGSSVVAAAPASLSSSSVFGSSCGVSSFAPVTTRASAARSVAVRASQSSNEVRDCCCILSFLDIKRAAL